MCAFQNACGENFHHRTLANGCTRILSTVSFDTNQTLYVEGSAIAARPNGAAPFLVLQGVKLIQRYGTAISLHDTAMIAFERPDVWHAARMSYGASLSTYHLDEISYAHRLFFGI
jgi:hypothetical protein